MVIDVEDRPTSVPPSAKFATAAGVAIVNILAQTTEILFLCLLAWLRSIDKVSEENLVWGLAAIVGPAVSAIKGDKLNRSSLITILAALPLLKKSLLAKLFLGSLVFSIIGCGSVAVSGKELLRQATKAAGPALVRLAENRGVSIDESQAACFPVSSVIEEVSGEESPVIALMCVAPKL